MIIDSILSLVSGGATGLIGSVVSRAAGYFEKKQEMESKKIDYQHEKELYALQAEEKAAERESEERIVDTKASADALLGSYTHDASYASSALRWVRPVLTLLLLVCSASIYFTSDDMSTQNHVAMQILYFAGVAVSWWFADRSGQRAK